jgi:hypothetical protein
MTLASALSTGCILTDQCQAAGNSLQSPQLSCKEALLQEPLHKPGHSVNCDSAKAEPLFRNVCHYGGHRTLAACPQGMLTDGAWARGQAPP